MRWTWGWALALVATLSGCAGGVYVPVESRGGLGSPSTQPGVPTEQRASQQPHEGEGVQSPSSKPAPPPPSWVPSQPSAPLFGSEVSRSPALLALLDQATRQQQAGEAQRALASLARAQRIAPRDPRIYLQLAQVRLAMGDPARAAQLIERGLALSGEDRTTRRELLALKEKMPPK